MVDSLPFINKTNTPRKYTLCKSGDVAFADASEDTNEVGKAVELFQLGNDKVVCGLHTIHGRDKSGCTMSGFKGYAFNSMAFHYQMRRIAQGTKIYSISTRNFEETYIGVPSKGEQSKVAKLLSLIDKRIATQIGLINKLQSLISGIIQHTIKDGLAKQTWKKVVLSTVLTEHKELNTSLYSVYSVSVSEGVVNQIEYLGRSFAAKDTSHYHVVKFGDIVYTKSPTGDFPFGIVKQSMVSTPVAVSPLYGVYKPITVDIGLFLHYYFMSSVNANNYLQPLIQKGAKNTINIGNQRFLENVVPLPIKLGNIKVVSNALTAIQKKIDIERCVLTALQKQRQYLLRMMFI